MNKDQVSNEMAEIMLRMIDRDEAQERDQARYDRLSEKLQAMEHGQ